MATAEQRPGNLNIVFRAGDEFATTIDFSIDMTGYEWATEVYSVVNGLTVVEPTIDVIDDGDGKINLSLTEEQTASLAPGTYGVRIRWIAPGTVVRTALDGICEVLP